MKVGTIDFAVYEDGRNFLGLAKIGLPDFSSKKLNVNGAGIPGDVDIPVIGHLDAMTMTIDFVDHQESQEKLAEMRVHVLDLRVAKQQFDKVAGKLAIDDHKYVVKVIPVSKTSGELAPASAQTTSNTYSCLYFAEYIKGKLIRKHDPFAYEHTDASGTNVLDPVKQALGM